MTEELDEGMEQASKEMSALNVLLGATPARQHEEIVIRKRDGLPGDLRLEVGSLTDREFKALSEEAEKPAGNRQARRGQTQMETDPNMFLRLVVAAGTTNPNFNDPSVTSTHDVTFGHQVVQKILLPGEIAKVAEIIMDLSGFNESTVEYAGGLIEEGGLAKFYQMGMRLFHWSPETIYKLHNVDHAEYPNLPPPPNPVGFQAFMFACINETVKDMNKENSPDASRAPSRRQV